MSRRGGAGVHEHETYYHAHMMRYGRRVQRPRQQDTSPTFEALAVILACLGFALLAMAWEGCAW